MIGGVAEDSVDSGTPQLLPYLVWRADGMTPTEMLSRNTLLPKFEMPWKRIRSVPAVSV